MICGLSGGVDSAVAAVLIHEAIGHQLTCVFVDHGLMRAGRGRAGRQPVPRPLQHPARPCGRRGAVPRRPRRAHRPGGQAQVHRQDLHRHVRGGGAQDRRRRFPRPGHALSGRDRERQLHRRPVGDDQEPPQCRRPARADEHEAGRAACANCSRTRCASSAASSAFPKPSSAATPSPAPASPSASPAR